MRLILSGMARDMSCRLAASNFSSAHISVFVCVTKESKLALDGISDRLRKTLDIYLKGQNRLTRYVSARYTLCSARLIVRSLFNKAA